MTSKDIDFIIDTIETAIEWAEYADPYFQAKHGLESDKNNVRKSIELLNVLKLEQPKTCDGCQWNPMTHLHHAYCRPCMRQVHLMDNYKPKVIR